MSQARRSQAALSPRWWAFHLLLSLYPLTFFIGSNPELITVVTPDEVGEIFLYCLLFWFFNLAVHYWRGGLRWNLMIYVTVFSSYLWRPYFERVDGSIYVVFLIFVGLWALLLVGIARFLRSAEGQKIATFSLGVLSVLPLLQFLLATLLTATPTAEKPVTVQSAAAPIPAVSQVVFTRKPNVYLLVFDTMTSPRYYRKNLLKPGVAAQSEPLNAGLLGLMDLGFVVQNGASSNYGRTNESMGAFFSLNYVPHANFKDAGFHHFPQSAFWQAFQQQGYQVVASTASRSNTQSCPVGIDRCIFMPREDVIKSFMVNGTPLKQFITILDRVLFRHSLFQLRAWLLTSVMPKKLQHLDKVKSELAASMPFLQPTLAYLHFYGPHPPNIYDSHCKDPRRISIFDQNSGESRNAYFSLNAYADEYLCFLQQGVDLAGQILQKDPQAWILMFSDHGPGVFQYGVANGSPWDQARRDATFEVFRALHCPAAEKDCQQALAGQASNTNWSRQLINVLAGKKVLPPLPERQFSLGFKNQQPPYFNRY